ncbi:MAG: hypothetical protein O3B13_01820 [Planctomycetota bacterium]|nr:hypothetical protein [Planctomycetota bacterium]MDA1161818.1 hypothetical protein [Planctomycetota bacterium]
MLDLTPGENQTLRFLLVEALIVDGILSGGLGASGRTSPQDIEWTF